MGSIKTSSGYSIADNNIGTYNQISSSDNEELSFVKTITPSKTFGKNSSYRKEDKRIDETPSKNLPLKRKSLMHDMESEEDNQSSALKHPMEMRSRKRSKFKPYYDYEDYVDFAEDLRFLFDGEENEKESKTRSRRSKKKRCLNITRQDLSDQSESDRSRGHSQNATSKFDASISATSEGIFSKKLRPNLSPNISESNKNLTSIVASNVICSAQRKNIKKCSEINNFQNLFPISDIKEKRQKRNKNIEELDLGQNKRFKIIKNCEINVDKQRLKRVSCVIRKIDESSPFLGNFTKNILLCHQEKKNNTVTKMALRRRNSTPSLEGDIRLSEGVTKSSGIFRTISTPAPRRSGMKNTEDKVIESQDWHEDAYSCDDSTYSEQFVDSPDSGFVSESSCSAATPDGESTLLFSAQIREDESDYDETKLRVSRSSSNDSGIQIINNEKPLLDHNQTTDIGEEKEERLILCEKPILEAQRLKREQQQREEEERLCEEYQCRWFECPSPFGSRSTSDLHSHLENYHADNFCCKWNGCRCFGKMSRKTTFLLRHIGEHSGEKPHKCIIENCGASFSSLPSWRRHVEAHYSEVSYPKARIGGENGAFPKHLLNSRRVKDKRKTLANRHDCMDGHTLCIIKNALIRNEVAMETDDVINEPRDIVFHPEVIGQRTDDSGKKLMLVNWTPNNMIPNEWVSEADAMKVKRIKKTELPWNAKTSLKKLFFFGREASGRKSSRKSALLKSLF